MTRLNSKYTRVYANGYDVSGVATNIGAVGVEVEEASGAAYSDEVVNIILGNSSMKCGPINAFLSPSAATGLHELMSAGNVIQNIMIPFGTIADPTVGMPCFAWTMQQGSYQANGDNVVGVTINYPQASYSTVKGYDNPFGLLVHAKGAETAANTAIGTIDNGAASAKGGIFAWQLFSSDGTCTLSIDDSATNLNNAAFAALSGATSGEIDATTTPASGMIALAKTATVRQYLRWQIALNSATTATFALAFIRGT
jgi:hypothetical protein